MTTQAVQKSLKLWGDRPKGQSDETFRRSVRRGNYRCAHNRTTSSRSPGYAPADPKQTCPNVATHVETKIRSFVMGTYRYEVPLCDDHEGWYW